MPKQFTILLVDDDKDCRMLLREAVSAAGSDVLVYEVASGHEAIDYLHPCGPFAEAYRPDLIYLDASMPGLSGMEVLTAVKNAPDLQDIPVVMMTGDNDDELKLRAARIGANGYVVKSPDPATFRQTVMATTHYWQCVHQSPRSLTPSRCETK